MQLPDVEYAHISSTCGAFRTTRQVPTSLCHPPISRPLHPSLHATHRFPPPYLKFRWPSHHSIQQILPCIKPTDHASSHLCYRTSNVPAVRPSPIVVSRSSTTVSPWFSGAAAGPATTGSSGAAATTGSSGAARRSSPVVDYPILGTIARPRAVLFVSRCVNEEVAQDTIVPA